MSCTIFDFGGILMAICYDKLWKLLIDKKMNRTELKEVLPPESYNKFSDACLCQTAAAAWQWPLKESRSAHLSGYAGSDFRLLRQAPSVYLRGKEESGIQDTENKD